MISIIHNFELKWPFYVRTYLQISGNIGGVSTELFSFECLINDFDLDISVTYLKALADTFIYLGFLIVSAFLFLAKGLVRKKADTTSFVILGIVLTF